ncbi:monovalent cation/H(+) antiporter subunit G [Vibrio sp. CAU 1672]|uniref:monovalent cation/H(+) antiporter subunit G n=1 Tax=Vibrio sp. CAU 1672 TaxID=3032594 RepID=UPI0023DB1620|nr:monovalent cation/H(+) antiporter subunit G [Vibrio sp. CAU 1672]MDF2153843.1 monovalent cation/H(+) antiporter subunit G [Vibrio sp. CAU 1672]
MALLVGLLLLIGTLFMVIASLGIVRLPDLYTRMHAATKAGTIGLVFILLAVALSLQDISVWSRVVGTVLFIFLTAPVAAHLLGKTMLRRGYKMWRKRKSDSGSV